MIALFLALILATQEPPAAPATDAPQATAPEAAPPDAAAPVAAPAEPETPWPTGAPRDDYGLVGWCFGVLEGYLAQHDRVMPDVTRIEKTYRRPGSSLEEDLKVYADQQVLARAHLKSFTAALQAAEKASLSSLRPGAKRLSPRAARSGLRPPTFPPARWPSSGWAGPCPRPARRPPSG